MTNNKESDIKDSPEKKMSVIDVFFEFADEDYEFCPFTSLSGTLLFRYLWLIPSIPLVITILSTVWAQSIPKKLIWVGSDLRTTEWAVSNLTFSTATIIAPCLGVLLIVTVMLKRFTKNAPKIFFSLAAAGRLNPSNDSFFQENKNPQVLGTMFGKTMAGFWKRYRGQLQIRPRGWQTYARDLNHALQSPWRHVLTIVLLILIYLAAIVAALQGKSYLLFVGGIEGVTFSEQLPFLLWAITLIVISPPFISILISTGIWILIVIGTYLQWLIPIFEIDIQPSHGDMCGGLKRVGNLCLQMAAILTVPASVFGFWVLAQILVRVIPIIVIAMYGSIAIMLLTGVIVFFLPLWRIHLKMVSEKDLFHDKSVQQLAPIEERLRELAAQGVWHGNEVQELERKLDKLEKLYPKVQNYPTWPFDSNILIKLFSPQLVPLIALITGLNDEELSPFWKLFKFIFGLSK